MSSALAASEPLPDPNAILESARKEAEQAATQVYGNPAGEIERLRDSLAKISARLEQIDGQVADCAKRGDLGKIRALAEESSALKAQESRLKAQIDRLRDRARERDEYFHKALENAIRKRIAELEPYLRAQVERLAELLDATTPLLEKLPEYQQWRIGLLYWVFAILADEMHDEHLKNLLRRHLPIAFRPNPLDELFRS